ETGANPFFSVVHAALRLADTSNFTVLARMFPKTHQELMLLRDSAKYSDDRFTNVVSTAALMVKLRNILGVGIVLFEISTEIASAFELDADEVHYLLSQNYDVILKQANEI
ncbi:MAG: hypothetical protein ACXABD_20805, partial [Candidatus Thorarchaeota archaeon]